MRGDLANSSGNANAWHEVGEEEAKLLAEFEAREGSQRIAAASGSSSYDARIGLRHPPTASVRADQTFAQQMQAGARDDELH